MSLRGPIADPSVWAGERDGGLTARDLFLILAFWTFVAALSATTRLLDPRVPGTTAQVQGALVRVAFAEYYLWALLTVPIFWLSTRLGIEGRRRVMRLAALALVGLVAAIAVDWLIAQLRAELLPRPRRGARGALQAAGAAMPDTGGWWGGGLGPRAGGLRAGAPFGFIDDFMIYVGVLAAGVARDYFLRYQMRLQESAHLHAHTARLQAQLAEARLTALRGQLNPHFLFNTLNAVSALVERDARGVRRMIARLSELLRHTLDESAEQELPLERELELLRRYVEIMEIRFRNRLEVRIQVAADARDALVPNLVLQPLVENAIEHGASKADGHGVVEVEASRRGEELVLVVRDNGPGPAPDAEARGGVGVANTRARLAELYGDSQRLTLRRATQGPGGAEVEIVLPFHTRAEMMSAYSITEE